MIPQIDKEMIEAVRERWYTLSARLTPEEIKEVENLCNSGNFLISYSYFMHDFWIFK